MIRTFNYFISGFTENRSQVTGLWSAWHTCHQTLSNPETFITGKPWNYDWYHEARFLQNCNGDGAVRINIFGYSWGAGFGAMEFARQLRHVGGYAVDTMVLADPVYCSRWRAMRWRAVFADRVSYFRWATPVIIVPDNVREVYWSRQYKNWPRAHSLRAESVIRTSIHPAVVDKDDREHGAMDESPWFQEKVSKTWSS